MGNQKIEEFEPIGSDILGDYKGRERYLKEILSHQKGIKIISSTYGMKKKQDETDFHVNFLKGLIETLRKIPSLGKTR